MRIVLIIILFAVASPMARAQSSSRSRCGSEDGAGVLRHHDREGRRGRAEDPDAARTLSRDADARRQAIRVVLERGILRGPAGQPSRRCASGCGIRRCACTALIATVWTPYDFWIDGKFSHCGIDAFDLVKTDEGWKIAGGSYTLEDKVRAEPAWSAEAIAASFRTESSRPAAAALISAARDGGSPARRRGRAAAMWFR